MKKTLFLIFSFSIVNIVSSQWSIGLNGGFGEIRRVIPKVQLDNLQNAGLGIDLNYLTKSSSIKYNISSYLFTPSHSEIITQNSHNSTRFYQPIFIAVGSGVIHELGNYINITTSIQLGYLYSRSEHYNNYVSFGESLWEQYERKFSQFTIGPKINIGFGQKKLKGALIFENYFLSAPSGINNKVFGRERFTRLSLGLNYTFED